MEGIQRSILRSEVKAHQRRLMKKEDENDVVTSVEKVKDDIKRRADLEVHGEEQI